MGSRIYKRHSKKGTEFTGGKLVRENDKVDGRLKRMQKRQLILRGSNKVSKVKKRRGGKVREKLPHIKEGGREGKRKGKRGRSQQQKGRRGGRQGNPESRTRQFKLKWNPLFDCRRPNAEILVRQLYKKCETAGPCINNLDPSLTEERKVWKSVNAIFSRFSYVSPQLRKFITTKEFRKDYMFDGERLTRNTNEYRLLSPTHSLHSSYYESFGLSNLDGKFPDAFARTGTDVCPQVPHTIFNCYGKCRRDNCNENPPDQSNRHIDVSDRVPNILSIPLNKFIAADFKDFVDPFLGQLGYLIREDGSVKNADGTWTYYKNNDKFVRSNLARVSKWNGKDIWDGVGMDPYRQMGEQFKI